MKIRNPVTGIQCRTSLTDSKGKGSEIDVASSNVGMRPRDILLLLAIGCAAVLIHGYHPNAEDAEIYLPGVEKQLQPSLFPFNQQFFSSHARFTIFPQLIAGSVRATHWPFYKVLLFWHCLSIFLLLFACYYLASMCTTSAAGRWAAVAFVAGLLTLPIAGTALYIMDQYVNPRNLSAFAAVLAIALVLEGRHVLAGLCLLLGLAIHPFMSFFAFALCGLLILMRWAEIRTLSAACVMPLSFLYPTPTPAYHEVALSHPYHYLLHWQWYECLGAIGPLMIFWWFGRLARAQGRNNLRRLCGAAILLGTLSLIVALVLAIPKPFEVLARIQPLRSFYLLYLLLLIFTGVFLGEYVLKTHWVRWVALFLPICIGMFLAQRALFPQSAHIELPGIRSKNPWVEAFEWIRDNTPRDAIFALDPYHMRIQGEDANGFRAITQRSMLADAVKDSGAVSMFPPLAEEWLRQVDAQRKWKDFSIGDYQRLQSAYGVNWIVVQQPPHAALDCPYQNYEVAVCRLDLRKSFIQPVRQ